LGSPPTLKGLLFKRRIDVATENTRSSGSGLWAKFAKRHKGNPSLQLDPLYALPPRLIDVIAGKSEGPRVDRTGVAPGLWTEQEVAFERDLAQTAGGGFFCRQPFDCLLLSPPADPRVAQAEGEIQTMLAENLEDEGVHPARAKAILDDDASYREMAGLRAAAYAGWLVTSKQFREERDALRERWGEHVQQERRFPALRLSFLGGLVVLREQQGGEAYAHFALFYRRWGLETFLTWDLPLPMRPALHGAGLPHTAGLSEAGVHVFLPWYLLRDGRFQLKELARHLQDLRNPEHLAGWLETATASRGELGDTRLCNLLVLYRYQKLAIAARYAGRAGWGVETQDVAFGKLLGLLPESARQVRLHLQKRLAG
jgi:hypothetical protein